MQIMHPTNNQYNNKELNLEYKELLNLNSLKIPNRKWAGVSTMAQQDKDQALSLQWHKFNPWVQCRPAAAAWRGGLRIWCCHELWCRSQVRLGSGVAMAVI